MSTNISTANGLESPWWKRETLPSRVDFLAQNHPDRVYAAYPRSPLTYDDGFREISYAELANAVNGVAWLLDRALKSPQPKMLAYIGPNDIRYTALILGAAKAGHQMLLISPRNSIAAQIHLFRATDCEVLLSPSLQPPQIPAILEQHDIRCIHVPSAEDLLDSKSKHYPYSTTLEEAKHQTFFAVHTSGSTGMPKPLLWNHALASTNIEHMQLDPPPGYESQDRMVQGNRVFITFPPFHGAFLASHLFNAIPHSTVMIAPASGAIATGQGLVDALKHTEIDVAFLVPSIALDLAQDSHLLDFVAARVKKIFYCGGDLPQSIGDIIAAKIPLYNQYGASEMGLTPQIWGNRTGADWKYIEPHPNIGADMRYVTGNLFEYNIVRNPQSQEQPAAFEIFPDLDAYPSRDLYVQHPTNPKLWRWQARVDDVIVFLNGEKTNPNSFEQHIATRNFDVARALVAGSQRFQASLLIEPVDQSQTSTTGQRAEFIERIWPSVEEANQVCPAHAKVAKSHILFTSPNKPMMIAGKGTVQRAGTVAMYEQELDKLYADADSAAVSGSAEKTTVNIDDEAECLAFVSNAVQRATGIVKLGKNDNMFTLGMDSLQALLLLRNLKRAPGLSPLALSTIYTNPTIMGLVRAMQAIRKGDAAKEDLEQVQANSAMYQMLNKYKAVLDEIKVQPATGTSNEITILLTGSTGALGCHLLQCLLSNPAIKTVHCLNRASDGGRSLQMSRLAKRGLPSNLASDPRLQYHHTDLARSDMGLSNSQRQEITATVTHVIHGAWPVDFNLPLPAFEPHIQGTVNLLCMVATSAHPVRFMFISSISSVMNHHTEPAVTPEAVVEDFKAPASIGYARSKLIAELVVAYASQIIPTSKMRMAFARIGQVAGTAIRPPSDGVLSWNPAEWFPSLVLSSVHIGALPDSLGSMGRIDWVPMDILSQVLYDLTLDETPAYGANDASDIEVFHPHSPIPTSWSSVQRYIHTEAKEMTGHLLEVVPVTQWLDRVQAAMEEAAVGKPDTKTSATQDVDMKQLLKLNPAAKLLPWYRESLSHARKSNILDTKLTAGRNALLKNFHGLEDIWVRRWVREWLQYVGVVPD